MQQELYLQVIVDPGQDIPFQIITPVCIEDLLQVCHRLLSVASQPVHRLGLKHYAWHRRCLLTTMEEMQSP